MNCPSPKCRGVAVIPTPRGKCPWCDHVFDIPTPVQPRTDPLIEIPALLTTRLLHLPETP